MKPLPVEPFLKVYMLLKQDGTYLYPTGFDSNNNMGTGFFPSQSMAELMRTKELLAMKPESTTLYHIYEIEIPNPAYKS